MKQAVTGYLVHLKASGRRPSTLESYTRSLQWLISALDDMPLRKVRPSDIDQAVAGLIDLRDGDPARSPATMNRIKSVYRSFFGWCHATGRVHRDPSLSLGMAKTEAVHTPPMTKSETEAFLKVIQQSDDPLAGRDLALFAVYAYSGIRRGEALALRRVDYLPSERKLMLPETKGGRRGVRHVPSPLATILNEYLARTEVNDGTGNYLPLFPGRNLVDPLSPRQVQLRFEHWKALAGLRPELTIHSFRAGYATRLHEVTGDTLLVSRALGHRDTRVTSRYIGENDTALREAVEKTFS